MSRKKNAFYVIKYLALAMILALSLSIAAAAYPSHKDHISDAAVIIGEEDENSIKAASEKLQKSRNSRIALCTVLNTEGKNIGDYARELFKEWNVGHGVLILIVTESDDFYAVQSSSVEEILTNEKLSEIINSTLGPAVESREYSKGALEAANALSGFLSTNLPEGFGAKKVSMPVWAVVLIVIVVVIAVICGGGYALLVYTEKKQARIRREEMEARRRMLMDGMGRSRQMRRPAPGYGIGMPDARQRDRRPPMSPASRNNAGYRGRAPERGERRAPQSNTQRGRTPGGRPTASRRVDTSSQTQMMNKVPHREPARGEAAQRRNVSKAATIQISTSDLKAAMQAQKKK